MKATTESTKEHDMTTETLKRRVRRLETDGAGTKSLAEQLCRAKQAPGDLVPTEERIDRLQGMKPSKLRDRLIRAYRRCLAGEQQ
jgi:hypothetical protein